MSRTGAMLQKAIGTAGGESEFQRKGNDYTRSLEFAEANRGQLLHDHDNQWVALRAGSVVAAGGRFIDVMKALRDAKVPVDEVHILYVSSEDVLTLYGRCA